MSDPKIADNGSIENYPFETRIPEGHERERFVCKDCGWIHYVNPNVVVGAVCAWEDRVLLCRRAIEPRRGFWTMPAGFLEEGETTEQGAVREAVEEANAPAPVGYLPSIVPAWTSPDVEAFGSLRLRLYRLRVMPGSVMTERTGQLLMWQAPSG